MKVGNWSLVPQVPRALELIGMYWIGVFFALTIVGVLHGLQLVYWIVIPVGAVWLGVVWYLVFLGRHRYRGDFIDELDNLISKIDSLRIERLDPGPSERSKPVDQLLDQAAYADASFLAR